MGGKADKCKKTPPAAKRGAQGEARHKKRYASGGGDVRVPLLPVKGRKWV